MFAGPLGAISEQPFFVIQGTKGEVVCLAVNVEFGFAFFATLKNEPTCQLIAWLTTQKKTSSILCSALCPLGAIRRASVEKCVLAVDLESQSRRGLMGLLGVAAFTASKMER